MAKAPAAPKAPGDDPSVVDETIAQLRNDARLCRTLMGGTKAMRAAGELYLPKALRETDETYERRLKVTVLRNFYRQTLTGLAGKLMRNGLRVDTSAADKPPAEMETWLANIDNAGTPGDVMFKRAFVWAVRDAAMWLYAAYPKTGGKQTLADEREKNIRPYLLPLSIWDVNGMRWSRGPNGSKVLDQFRYQMVSEEPDGQFGKRDVTTIRVIEPTLIRDFRQNAKGEWALFDESMNTLGRVPINRIASDMDEDAHPRGGMNDLADLNLEHWQVRSDQRLALRMNSFPILFGAGIAALPPVGPESAVLADDAGASLAYVESTGAALTAGRQELVDLEDAMRAMGASYQAKGSVQRSATESTIDMREANSAAQGWAINAKRGFEAAMDDMAELASKGKGPGAGGILRIDTDSLVASFDAAALAELRAARVSRDISRETYLGQLKRWDVLPDDFDIEHDKSLIDDEEPEGLGGMNDPANNRE